MTTRIPVGVEEQTALQVPRRGLPAAKPGLPPGDLHVIVRTATDAPFERHGRDLYCMEQSQAVIIPPVGIPSRSSQALLKGSDDGRSPLNLPDPKPRCCRTPTLPNERVQDDA